jgi:hypothetical protein
MRALARVRSPSPTTLGKAARIVGLKNVRARPIRKTRTYRPTRSRVKTAARISTARARSLATRMTRRSRRSASTPTSGLASVGTRRATRRPPTAEALPERSTTRITSATVETKSPTKEIPWPTQSRMKRPFLRSEPPPVIFPPKERTPSLS